MRDEEAFRCNRSLWQIHMVVTSSDSSSDSADAHNLRNHDLEKSISGTGSMAHSRLALASFANASHVFRCEWGPEHRDALHIDGAGDIDAGQRLFKNSFQLRGDGSRDARSRMAGAGRLEQSAAVQQLFSNCDAGLLFENDQRREPGVNFVDPLPVSAARG